MNEKTKVIAVVGPTASGKSSLAIGLAKAMNGEIVSCDSMQIYTGMDIGTAKLKQSEMKGIKHHLMGFLPQDETFSVSDYVIMADNAIETIKKNNKLPIIAGGTGLYARSLLYGVSFSDDSRDDRLREKLAKRIKDGEAMKLYNELEKLDPIAAGKIHINNEKRLVRAIEYCLVTGKLFSEQSIIEPENPKYDFLMLCIGFRDRDKLYTVINERVDTMMSHGLLNEAMTCYISNKNFSMEKKTSMQSIGNKELFPYFDKKITLDEAIENIKRETRRYAKRQLTWFKKEKKILWLYADEYKNQNELFNDALTFSEQFMGK